MRPMPRIFLLLLSCFMTTPCIAADDETRLRQNVEARYGEDQIKALEELQRPRTLPPSADNNKQPENTPQEQILKNAYKKVLNEKVSQKLQERIDKENHGLYVWSQTEGRLIRKQLPSTKTNVPR